MKAYKGVEKINQQNYIDNRSCTSSNLKWGDTDFNTNLARLLSDLKCSLEEICPTLMCHTSF